MAPGAKISTCAAPCFTCWAIFWGPPRQSPPPSSSWTTGWTPIDTLLSLLIVLLIVRSAWSLVRQSGHILLEGSPQDMDLEAVRHAIQERVDDVVDVHHLHAWSLTPEHPILTLHARLRPEGEDKAVLAAIKGVLADEFKIRHATVQLEHGPCPDGPDCAVDQTAGT